MVDSASNGYWAPFVWFLVMLVYILVRWFPTTPRYDGGEWSKYEEKFRKWAWEPLLFGVPAMIILHFLNKIFGGTI